MTSETDATVPIYYQSAREDLLRLVPMDAGRVLDVGCGTGQLGAALKQRGVPTVTGIELDCEAAQIAAGILDRVICASAELVVGAHLDPPYDCIVFGDVLEHLTDPWGTLRRLAALLSPGGHLVASLPNVAHWTIIFGLLRGRWTYQNRGLLDRAHLRFFTRRSISALFAQAGLTVERWERNYRLHETDRRHARLARWLARGPARDLLTYQYLVVARRSQGTQ